jgi:phosphoglycolate phosphatase
MSHLRHLRGVLFDLDGTLLDTAPDLAWACNTAVAEAGFRPLPAEALRPFVSGGATAMLRASLARDNGEVTIEPILQRMLALYEANIAVHTRLFEGMADVLDELERRGMAWGIVTNKLTRFTEPLLHRLDLARRPGCVISGDTCAESKPHPLPILEACRRIDRAPRDCVYIGDARRDIEAGHNAGMLTLAALYGYVPTDDPAEDWGAHGLLARPAELLDWLDGRA